MSEENVSKEAGAKRGLECPRCGCRHLGVVYSRPRADKTVVRRRECRHCGRRITTTEASNE
jgi:transcriptional regulator NrdR family protein